MWNYLRKRLQSLVFSFCAHLCGGTLTGMEVADRKSVIRFLLTISVSALPGSRREEDRDTTLLDK